MMTITNAALTNTHVQQITYANRHNPTEGSRWKHPLSHQTKSILILVINSVNYDLFYYYFELLPQLAASDSTIYTTAISFCSSTRLPDCLSHKCSLSSKSSPTQSQPPHLPEQEILWTFVAHWSCGSSCVYYYAICMTILQFQVVPEDTNQTCCRHNTPLLKHPGNKPHTASHGSSGRKNLKRRGETNQARNHTFSTWVNKNASTYRS